MVIFAVKKMDEKTIEEISLHIYNDYKNQFRIFSDKILSKSQFASFANMTLNEYHGGTHHVKIIANDWVLWCYHRYIGITHAPTSTEIVIESLDAPFFCQNSKYDSYSEIDCDIRCFIELFEYAYQKYIGG